MKTKRQANKSTARLHSLSVRVTEKQEKLIRLGAKQRGLTVTSLILASASAEAEHALTKQNGFVLSANRWRQFTEALDRPAKVKPALAKLLLKPSVLD